LAAALRAWRGLTIVASERTDVFKPYPLAQLTASLRSLNAADLRDHGSIHLQRLEAEIERLAAALRRYVDLAEAQRP